MNAIHDLIARLHTIVFRRREERELAEELEFHVAMEAEVHTRGGLGDAEARRRAVMHLGGVERVKDDVRDARGTRWIEETIGDCRFTIRTLRHNPGFALAAILTLAIGIGGTTAVFSAVDAVLLQPLPYLQPGQLVRLYQSYGKEGDIHGFVTPVHFVDYRARMSSFASAAAVLTYNEKGGNIISDGEARRIRLLPVTADYFDVVRVQPVIGRGFERRDENGAPMIVLSHALWEQQMKSDPAAIGRPLTMNGVPYTILGVMPKGFSDPLTGSVDAWTPFDLTPAKDLSNAGNHYLSVIARLRSGASITSAQAELDALGHSLAQQYPDARDKRARLYPLKDDIVGSSSRSLEIMLGAVAVVLVLICVNIANLLLVRGSERAPEFAVRSALGGERTRLVRQMLIESLTLALAGCVAGLVVARLAMVVIVNLGSASIPRLAALTLDARVLCFSLLTASLCAVAFGLLPALRVARVDPANVLRESGRAATGSSRQMRVRDWLVISQVAFAFVLLVGAGLLVASFRKILSLDLGVRPANVLVFDLQLPEPRYDSTRRAQFYEHVAQRIAAVPGVLAAGGVSRLPATGKYHQWGAAARSGPLANTKEGGTTAENRVVSGDYFRAAGIPLLEGRMFDARDDAGAPHRLVVSKSLALHLFPGVSAVGQRLLGSTADREIIGVVGDVAVSAEGEPDQYVYHAHRQFAGDRNWELTQVVRVDGAVDRVEGEVRRTIASLDPQLVMYQPMTLAAAIGRGEAQRALTLVLLTSFAAVAVVVSALGLFGVLSYGVRMRSREFGIRMALGAERGAIRRMILRQGLAVTAIGLTLGLIGAFGLARVMASVVFRTSPLDPMVLAAAVLLMGVVAGVAAYLPAYRATRVNPRTALQ